MVVLLEFIATIVTVLVSPYHMVTVGHDPEEERVVVVSVMRCIVYPGGQSRIQRL